MTGGAVDLVISLSNIGDAIMTTPVMEALHARDHGGRMDLVVDRRSGELFECFPYVRRRIVKDKRAGIRGMLALVRDLRKTHYRYVVDLRTDGLAWLLRAERRFTRRNARPIGPHAVQAHWSVLEPLMGGTALPDTRIRLDPALLEQAQRRLQAFGAHSVLALGPGANWPGKIWPHTHFTQLAGRLGDLFDGVVLLGSAGDAGIAGQIEQRLSMPCLNLTGRTRLLEAAALLAQARVFVGNDSGLGHLAAAVATPTLTIFGPGRPDRYRPWGARSTWIVGRDGAIASVRPACVERLLRDHLADMPAAPL